MERFYSIVLRGQGGTARPARHVKSSQVKSCQVKSRTPWRPLRLVEVGQEGRTTSPQVPSQAHSRASLSTVARYAWPVIQVRRTRWFHTVGYSSVARPRAAAACGARGRPVSFLRVAKRPYATSTRRSIFRNAKKTLSTVVRSSCTRRRSELRTTPYTPPTVGRPRRRVPRSAPCTCLPHESASAKGEAASATWW